MKIITSGLNTPGWSRQIVCKGSFDSGCGALLEVGQADLYASSLPGTRGLVACCVCPECGTEVGIRGILPCCADLPWREEWEAAHPDLVALEALRGGEMAARREAARKKYGEGNDVA